MLCDATATATILRKLHSQFLHESSTDDTKKKMLIKLIIVIQKVNVTVKNVKNINNGIKNANAKNAA